MKHEFEIRVSWYPEDRQLHNESMVRLTDRIANRISNLLYDLRDKKVDLNDFRADRDIRYACVLDPDTGDSLLKVSVDINPAENNSIPNFS